ncbi:MAG: WG repeat-containing protein [Endomicrobia bacterium]|nr:WG repeat-containing protein [Endomicrobiia bacterium]
MQLKEPPELIPYCKENKWGYCDKNGNIVIDCKYDYADYFSEEDLARVELGGKLGYIDKSGKEYFY